MNKIEFVLVLIFTFFVIVVWITSEVILVRPNLPDDPKIQTMLEPLQSTFDQETLNRITNQAPAPFIKPSAAPQQTPTPQPSASVRPTATPRPTPTPRPGVATSSATESTGSGTIPATTP